MKTGIAVGDLMTRNYISTSPETNLRDCAKLMIKKRVGSLIIKNKEDKLEGILTEKDIIWALVKKSKEDLSKIPAKDLMKRKVITIKPSLDITEALRKLNKYKIRRFPVIQNKKVIGMITTKDILKIDPGLFELIAESTKIKEESGKLKATEKLRQSSKDGMCEECGNTDLLYKNDGGVMVCATCLDD